MPSIPRGSFVGIVEKDPGSAFGVWFPDVPGTYAAADNFDDVTAQAEQALRLHIEALESAGRAAPAARPYEEIVAAEDVRAALAAGASVIVTGVA